MRRQAKGPGGESEALQSVICGDSPILPESTVTATSHAAAIPGYVVVVSTREDRLVRRVFLSLHGAVRAFERARDRGQESSVTLCELRPTEAVIV